MCLPRSWHVFNLVRRASNPISTGALQFRKSFIDLDFNQHMKLCHLEIAHQQPRINHNGRPSARNFFGLLL